MQGRTDAKISHGRTRHLGASCDCDAENIDCQRSSGRSSFLIFKTVSRMFSTHLNSAKRQCQSWEIDASSLRSAERWLHTFADQHVLQIGYEYLICWEYTESVGSKHWAKHNAAVYVYQTASTSWNIPVAPWPLTSICRNQGCTWPSQALPKVSKGAMIKVQ